MTALTTGLPIKLLLVHQEAQTENAAGRASRAIIDDLNRRGYTMLVSTTSKDAQSVIAAEPLVGCLLLDWDLESDEGLGHREAAAVLSAFRARNDKAPVLLIGRRSLASDIPLPVLEMTSDFIWLLEDSSDFIMRRIETAMRRHADRLLPPMFDALIKFAQVHGCAWQTLGQTGGTAFHRTPISHAFYNCFGESIVR